MIQPPRNSSVSVATAAGAVSATATAGLNGANGSALFNERRVLDTLTFEARGGSGPGYECFTKNLDEWPKTR